jgi:RHS repeat-associated protein
MYIRHLNFVYQLTRPTMKPIIKKGLFILLELALIQKAFSQAPNISYSGSTTITSGTPFTLSPANTGGAVPATTYGQVTLVAGGRFGTGGYVNATGTAARFNAPQAIVGDASGNLYIADGNNNAIRKITPAGVVTTFAGSATGASGSTNGTGTAALFNSPSGLAIDGSGNLFVADGNNNAIRKITSAGVVTTFASSITSPAGLNFDASGNLIVALYSPCKIIKISPAGVVTTIAGSGNAGYINATGTAAYFFCPEGAQADASGNLFVADYLNNAIRKITTAGVVSTFAGSSVNGNAGTYANGLGTAARFNNPTGVTIGNGGIVYVADFLNNNIRKIMPDGTVTLVAGSATQASGNTDGTGTAVLFNQPDAMYIDGSGNGYISEYANSIRKIVLTGYSLTGTLPAGLSFDPTTGIISGTPTGTVSAKTDTITAYNASGYATTTVTFSPGAVLAAPNISYTASTTLSSGTPFTISPVNTGGAVPATTYGQVTTLAGSGTLGYVNGTGTAARFNIPFGAASDASGNLYIADGTNNAIRKVTPAGVVTTFAGSTTGASGFTNATGTSATFNAPVGIVMDASGNLFVGDAGNNAIRKITSAGVVTTFYQSSGTFSPAGLSFDGSGNLIVTAQDASQIWKITTAGVMTVIAGSTYGYTNASGTSAQFAQPEDVQTDGSGNIYVADYLNNAIRKISPTGVVTTLAGSTTSGNTGGFADGLGTAAKFNNPVGVALSAGGIVYVADLLNNNIRRVMPDGTVTLVAGSPTQVSGNTDGAGTAALLFHPTDLYIDATGTGYIMDARNGSIRKILLTGYSLKGTLPAGLSFNPATGVISGTPTGTITAKTDTIIAYNATGYSTAYVTFGMAPTISYGGSQPYTYTQGITITPLTPIVTGNPVPYTGYTTTFAGNGTAASTDGTGTAASFYYPAGMATDSKGNIYVIDQGTNRIRKITPSAVVTTFAGSGTAGFADGTGTAAVFNHPVGLAADTAGNFYVVDQNNNAIRKITPAGVVTTLAGGTQGSADGTGSAAQFYHPTGAAVDVSGNVYVTDYLNNRIRKVTPAGVVTTFAGSTQGFADGTGTAAQFYIPADIAIDAAGNLYVADRGNYKIRKITSAGVVTTLAGNGTAGFADGPAATAEFNLPINLKADQQGNVYVSDLLNDRIRRIDAAAMVTTLAGSSTKGTTNGVGSVATFNYPNGSAFDPGGNFYVGDYINNLIRKVVTTPYTISPGLPAGLNFDPTTGAISGTPTTKTDTTLTFTITAYNMTGIGSTTINLTINGGVAINPSGYLNYILTFTPRIPLTDIDTLYGEPIANVNKSIQYFDGRGRALQTIEVGASPSGNDIVQPFAYDQFGREVLKYLPYTPTTPADGSYKTNALNLVAGEGQIAFYAAPPGGVSVVPDPFAGTSFEPSPLNRVIEQGAPGVPWQLSTSGISGSGHTVKTMYFTNNSTAWASDSTTSMQVALYKATANANQSRTLTANGYYTAGQLYVTITKDENWVSGRAGTVEEYKDKNGHIILKRVYNYTGTALQQLSTYYVYDDFGQLAYVLTPASGADGAGTISQTTLNNLCYQYRYDERGRLNQKKIPGKGWEYTVYSYLNQPVASQDSLQRNQNNWIFSKYDAMGRPVLTGTWNNGNTAIGRDSLQASITRLTANLWETPTNTGNGYTNVAWPTTSVTATLTTNYYDTYTGIPNLPATYNLATGFSNMTRSLPTVKKTAVLNTPADQLWDVMYYDDLGRATQTYAQHYLSGVANVNNYDQVTTGYNFSNQPTTVTRKHWNTASTQNPLVTIANGYTYDHEGRKKRTSEQITNGSNVPDPTTNTLISQLDYNEVGQVLTKHLHSKDGNTFLQNIGYTYNERGWLLGSSAPLFALNLYYNTLSNKSYNGNIMYQYWGTPGNQNSRFAYNYDRLNRMTAGGSLDNYGEYVSYDIMGNINSLGRLQNNVVIDSLGYYYLSGSNPTLQLQKITDFTTNDAGLKHGTFSFTYDGNGNLITDPSKGASGINIAYNLLNLPQNITGSKTITYTYDATGNKLRRVSPNTGNTDYINGIQYDGNITSTISFIQTEEGKALPNGAGYNYEYNLGDNLGNVRVSFDSATGSARLVQQDDYYPFGMEINRSFTSPKNEYLYNKKELQEELGEYDYGARFYDPVIGRWNTIDPLSEVSRRWSPYTYVMNNPVRNIDPDGMVTVTGPYGETHDIPASDHYSASGDIQVQGQSYSINTIKSEMPDIATEFYERQVTNNTEEDGDGGKKPHGETTTYRTLGLLTSEMTDYYYRTVQNFSQTVVGEEGEQSTTNTTWVNKEIESIDHTYHGIGVTSKGDIVMTSTAGNVTTTYILQNKSYTMEISTLKNGVSTGTITTTYPRVRSGFASFSSSFYKSFVHLFYIIAPTGSHPPRLFAPFGQTSPQPIPY